MLMPSALFAAKKASFIYLVLSIGYLLLLEFYLLIYFFNIKKHLSIRCLEKAIFVWTLQIGHYMFERYTVLKTVYIMFYIG